MVLRNNFYQHVQNRKTRVLTYGIVDFLFQCENMADFVLYSSDYVIRSYAYSLLQFGLCMEPLFFSEKTLHERVKQAH